MCRSSTCASRCRNGLRSEIVRVGVFRGGQLFGRTGQPVVVTFGDNLISLMLDIRRVLSLRVVNVLRGKRREALEGTAHVETGSVWMFERGADVIVLRSPAPVALIASGPTYPLTRRFEFSTAYDRVTFQTGFEQYLLNTGWSLSSFRASDDRPRSRSWWRGSWN